MLLKLIKMKADWWTWGSNKQRLVSFSTLSHGQRLSCSGCCPWCWTEPFWRHCTKFCHLSSKSEAVVSTTSTSSFFTPLNIWRSDDKLLTCLLGWTTPRVLTRDVTSATHQSSLKPLWRGLSERGGSELICFGFHGIGEKARQMCMLSRGCGCWVF